MRPGGICTKQYLANRKVKLQSVAVHFSDVEWYDF